MPINLAAPADASDSAETHIALCASRVLRQLMASASLTAQEQQRFDSIVGMRRKVQRGTALFQIDTPCIDLYAIRLGSFKSFQTTESGALQIFGFHFPGTILGLDGLVAAAYHRCEVTSLEDSEVLDIPAAKLIDLITQVPAIMHHFHWLMRREACRMQELVTLLGTMQAEQRFASFLTSLAADQASRGYSCSSLHLSMMREDIANYLGLSNECISRLLARFGKEGLIHVAHREIEIVNAPRLRSLADTGGYAHPIRATKLHAGIKI